MTLSRIALLFLLTIAAALATPAQHSRWASADDSTAKFMIASETKWAETACDHNRIATTILADDFQGTSTEGQRYSKADELIDNVSQRNRAHDCRLLDAKVHFFGDSLAVIYGSETSVRKGSDGNDKQKCQIWTDTWLKRNGKWQIIAAQDAEIGCKKSN